MSIATLGAIAIHELPEAVAVMLFFQVGELFQGYSVGRSRRAIKALLEARSDTANLQVAGDIQVVSPESVKVGNIILVRPGEKVPLNGEILERRSQIETSALTGESVPRTVATGDTVLSGTINQSGVLTVRVTKPFNESSISRILELVENASSKKAATEKFITRFARYYTPVVVSLSIAVAILSPLFIPDATRAEWVYRAWVLLVISCPCGLVISIPLGYFGGVGGAAKRGILVKGPTFLDALTQVGIVVFDKTGTLTKGHFRVTELVPENGMSQYELLKLAAQVESQSTHPVAQSILHAHAQSIETADVVIMTDAPSKVAEAIAISHRPLHIVWQNIILAMGIKAIFVALGTVGLVTLWQAVFADVGVALLAVLNAGRILKVKSSSQ